MTRVMRTSLYPDMYDPPITTVVRDCDLVDTLESARESLRRPGALYIFDIFDIPGYPGIQTATRTALQRMREVSDIERQMAIGYHYNARLLPRVEWMLANPDRAPYGVDECAEVLRQLAKHPAYDHQMIVVQSVDQRIVSMCKGKVKVDDA